MGYTADADVWCEGCTLRFYGSLDAVDREGNELGVLWPDSESDSPNHCAGCEAFLDTALTDDGRLYVWERLLHRDGNSDVLAEWAAQWPELNTDPDDAPYAFDRLA